MMSTKQRKEILELFRLILSEPQGVSEEVYYKMLSISLGNNEKDRQEAIKLFERVETKQVIRHKFNPDR